MLGYILFLLLVPPIIYLYVRYEREWKEVEPHVDHERLKCESYIERRVYDVLKARGETVLTQVPCGRYRIDIALPHYMIAIECDGKAYHSTKEQKAHDRRKNAFLRKHGWKVLRFSGSMICKRMPQVLARIEKTKGVG